MPDSILFWNDVALEAAKTDYSTPDPSVDPTPQQPGPTAASRAFAIVHVAMYDAYVGVRGGDTYLTYSAADKPTTNDLLAAQAAVSAAAALTLGELYSRQRQVFQNKLVSFVASLNGTDPKIAQGLAWGHLVARKLLDARADDGSAALPNFYVAGPLPGRHRPDPLAPMQGFLGPEWGMVKPFGVENVVMRVPGTAPPPLNSAPYATAFGEVKAIGRLNSTTRTPGQTAIGLFWAYDGSRNIGLPPRLYNQVVRAIAQKVGPAGTSEAQNARLFALINVAMVDAGIQAWYEKYVYNIWRPVVGIRESDAGWGPTGAGDGNNATAGDPFWVPLGAPKTNQPGKIGFTPPFPAYPSGHATFGTAALVATQKELNLADGFAFSLVSDELDGMAIDASGGQRPRQVRPLTIKTAIEENLISRVYLGVHWKFDADEGERNGRKIGELVQGKFPQMA